MSPFPALCLLSRLSVPFPLPPSTLSSVPFPVYFPFQLPPSTFFPSHSLLPLFSLSPLPFLFPFPLPPPLSSLSSSPSIPSHCTPSFPVHLPQPLPFVLSDLLESVHCPPESRDMGVMAVTWLTASPSDCIRTQLDSRQDQHLLASTLHPGGQN